MIYAGVEELKERARREGLGQGRTEGRKQGRAPLSPMLVPADRPDRKAAAQAAKNLRALRTRIGGVTVFELMSMRDEGRR